ncbi:MAG: HAD family phosphatase [Chloroflexota bacterium]
MRTFKCLCLDLDGTLVDTERLHVKAELHALRCLGISELSDEHPRTFGNGIERGADEMCKHYGINDASRYLAEYLPIWHRSLEVELELMPGARNLLEMTYQRHIPVALVTSENTQYTESVTRRLAIDGFFACTIRGDSVSHMKPHPEPYLQAAQNLGIAAKDCVGIEDSGAGVNSLISAGMYAIAVHVDAHRRPELSVAAERFTSLIEITDTVVERLFP